MTLERPSTRRNPKSCAESLRGRNRLLLLEETLGGTGLPLSEVEFSFSNEEFEKNFKKLLTFGVIYIILPEC